MAQQTNNVWFQQKKVELEALKRQLIEYNYSGSYGGALNLMQINNVIDGAVLEIFKLQKQNEVLAKELNKLIQEKKETSSEK